MNEAKRNNKLHNGLYSGILVSPGKKVKLKDFDPGWVQNDELRKLGKDEAKERASTFLDSNIAELRSAQELLWASDINSVLIILQGMDAAGKDGIIKHVMSGVNPTGCQVTNFKEPSAEELDHTFLWRHMKAVPARGMIGIFNRSHYEEVLVVKVHPEILDRQKLPQKKYDKEFWEARYDDINNFERHMMNSGTLVLKFFLNISKEEQRKRFIDRLEKPDKQWKFAHSDVKERDYWDQYIDAFENMLNRTSTKWAPWYVIPADHKWAARTLVASILTDRIKDLHLEYPKVPKDVKEELDKIKLQLVGEGVLDRPGK